MTIIKIKGTIYYIVKSDNDIKYINFLREQENKEKYIQFIKKYIKYNYN